jgi:hypothetical protein
MEKEILDDTTPPDVTTSKKSMKTWLKRIGFAGFLFFLIKGLVWIAVFAGMGKCVMG